MTLEGATVKVVAEIMPKSGGLTRNIVQCLEDYDIPLKLNHTVIDIKGKDHIEGVTLAKVDENKEPIPGTQEEYSCDLSLIHIYIRQCSIQIPAAHVAVLFGGDRNGTVCHCITGRRIGCGQESIASGAGFLYRIHAGKGSEGAFRGSDSAGPVSYTHLDVYKRQVLVRTGSIQGV